MPREKNKTKHTKKLKKPKQTNKKEGKNQNDHQI